MKLKQKFILRKLGNENILIPLAEKTDTFEGIISLNETGSFIWNNIEKGYSIEEITDKVIEEYEVDKEEAYQHVLELCNNFKKLGILE